MRRHTVSFSQDLVDPAVEHANAKEELDAAHHARLAYDTSNWEKIHLTVGSSKFAAGFFDPTNTKSLGIFGWNSKVRTICRQIDASVYFVGLILMLIVMSCVCLALEEHLPNGDTTDLNLDLEIAEYVFVFLFTIEMCIKVIANGFIFCGPPSYIRDNWNKLDFLIVVVGLATFGLAQAQDEESGIGGLSALRACRVLRPLRLISTVESLQIVLNSMILAVPKLINVLILLVFGLVLFSIIALQFYMPVASNQCFDPVADAWGVVQWENVEGSVCSLGEKGVRCAGEQVCRGVPGVGEVGDFNNFLFSFVTVFVCSTLEGWTDVLYRINDANGETVANFLFFFLVVLFTNYLIYNLFLGVLSGMYTKESIRLASHNEWKKEKGKETVANQLRGYEEWLTMADGFAQDVTTGHLDDNLPDGLLPFSQHARLMSNTAVDLTAPLAFASRAKSKSKSKKSKQVSALHDDDLPGIYVRSPNKIRGKHGQSRMYFWMRSDLNRCGVLDSDTVGNVRRKMFNLPPWATYALQPDGTFVSSTTHIRDLTIVLRTGKEYSAIEDLSHDSPVRREVEKSSTLTFHSCLGMVAKSKYFNWVILFMVFCNTTLFFLESHPVLEPKDLFRDIFEYSNIVFQCLFTVEALFKIFAIGWLDYWASKFNRVDLLVVVAGALELIICKLTGLPPIGISVLRAVRLIKLFRYTSYWEGMNDLSTAMLSKGGEIGSLVSLLMIYMVVMALLGKALFGGMFDTAERTNFNSMGHAFWAMFQVMTGENWNEVMGNGAAAYGGFVNGGWLSVIFFFLAVVFGDFFLLNIFLAIAVGSLDDAATLLIDRNEFNKTWQPTREVFSTKVNALLKQRERDERNRKEAFANPMLAQKVHQRAKADGEERWDVPAMYHWSCLPAGNTLRRKIGDFAFNATFNNIILVFIVLSSLCLAIEDYTDEEAEINGYLQYTEWIFTASFTIEMSVKMIGLGVMFHKGAYLRDPWNVLDFIVVLASLLVIALPSVKALKPLRTIRVLRPLRTINRFPRLRDVVLCLFVSVKKIGNIFVLFIMLICIFSAMGVQMFRGTFVSCNDGSIVEESACVGTFLSYSGDGLDEITITNREWSNEFLNFDNMGRAFVTLFTVQTTEGWVDVLHHSMDANEVGKGPILTTQNDFVSLFYLVYMFLMTFFMINMFIGYVVTTYIEEAQVHYKEADLSKNQRKCIDFIVQVQPTKKYQPMYRLQSNMQKIIWPDHDPPRWHTNAFENIVLGAIILNTVTLMMEHDSMTVDYEFMLIVFNFIFTFFFTAECLIKIMAFNPTVYFTDAWNFLDFVIVVSGLIDVSSYLIGDTSVNVSFLRLFRVARVLKLLSKGDDLRQLLFTFIKSFKELPAVVAMLFLFYFIFAIVGMTFFAKIELYDCADGIDVNNSCTIDGFSCEPMLQTNVTRCVGIEGIDVNNNFRDIFRAFQVLIRAMTGENWQQMMQACASSDQVAWAPIAYVYFILFNIINLLLLMNLFVAVIMDNFEYLTQDFSELGPHHLDNFVPAWAKLDPAGVGYISHEKLVDLFCNRRMPPPLGFGLNCPKRECRRFLTRMNIPVEKDGTVEFHATLLSLVRMRLDMYNDLSKGWEVENKKFKGIIRKFWSNTDEELLDKLLPDRDDLNITVGMLQATYTIQSLYRQKRASKFRAGAEIRKTPRLVRSVLKLQEFSDSGSVHKEQDDRGVQFSLA